MSKEAVVGNLTFDREFLAKVKYVENARRKTLHTNGVPMHYMLVFKIICVLDEEDLSIENVSVKYRDIFGRGINGSSLSRTLLYLSEKPKGGVLGLISYVDNPFTSDGRFKGVNLTAGGMRLKKILLGQSITPSTEHVKSKIRSA
jgi:hypothetical protein